MKIVNYMNFIREYDPRANDVELSRKELFQATKEELELAKEFDIPSTFLFEYDALIDEKYIRLFRENADAKPELGLWLEIPRQLLDKIGLPWRGNPDWTWDWKVIPGFSMAYTPEERKKIIDEAMHTFRDIFGYFPKTVASWLLDTYSVEYLTNQYHIETAAICRDQTSTDAYTLIGGYFNQAYYPSKKNIFTPAQTAEYQINTPVFRLLGPDPIHNYDNLKYAIYKKIKGCYTMEPVWYSGYTPEVMDWFFETYYQNEDLGFSYSQIGQENSMAYGGKNFIPAIRMQLEKLKEYKDVKFMTMAETGKWFKETYKETPATAVTALRDWNSDAAQSVYYDCKNYMANLFRFENKVFIRCMYLFDETAEESYLHTPCTTWDGTYENLPLIDTLLWEDNDGLMLDVNGSEIHTEKPEDGVLSILWDDKKITFSENEILLQNIAPVWNTNGSLADITTDGTNISYLYKGNSYSFHLENAAVQEENGIFRIIPDSDTCRLILK